MLVESALRRLRSLQAQLQPSSLLPAVSKGLLSEHVSASTPAMVGLQVQPAAAAMAAMAAAAAGAGYATEAKRRRLDDPDASVYIVSAVRTPLGAFQGSLAHLSATQLGAVAIRAAVERASLAPEAVEEVFMGNVCSANLGQAPARQAALKAGLPMGTDCTLVNKVCSSGMKAIMLGAQTILAGTNSLVVAGGMESMSNVPYYAPAMRSGTRLGHTTLVDGLLVDGLWDAFHDVHMGDCAELCAEKYGIDREAQDTHAIASVEKARAAAASGVLDWELVPVEAGPGSSSSGSGSAGSRLVTQDEAVSKMNADKLRRLKPFFRRDGGTVTAGNASPLTDGAAAVVLASADAVRRHGLPVLGRILGFGDAAQDPREFTTAPTLAVPKALAQAGLAQSDVQYWEINEAFSVVDLVNQRLLGLDPATVNVMGGAVAIGHPIGASGTRLIVTLLNVLRAKGARYGAAAICNGGGGASAMVIERLEGGLASLAPGGSAGDSSGSQQTPGGTSA